MGIRERKKATTARRWSTLPRACSPSAALRPPPWTTSRAPRGMSRTSVFNYFGYKEMILCEIGARYVQEVSGPILQDMDRAG